MDKFVTRENKRWEMPVKKGIQNKNSHSIRGEESAGLTFGLPSHPLEDVQAKTKHKLLRSNHPYYRNVAKHLWRETQIIKLENSFHIWINIGYICERTLSAMLRVTLPCASYRLQFTISTSIVLLLISSRISQNWFHWFRLIEIKIVVSGSPS